MVYTQRDTETFTLRANCSNYSNGHMVVSFQLAMSGKKMTAG